MPKLKENQVPSYRLHKQSGQAIVTLNGRDVLLGKHGTKESRDEYLRVTNEWRVTRGVPWTGAGDDFTVAELVLAFWRYAKGYYRKDGKPTTELYLYKMVLKLLRQLYGRTPAAEFGPKRLKAVIQAMVARKWCRTSINKHASRIKHVFKWAVGNELVPPSVHHGLTAVSGLAKGRTEAEESVPVRPVPEQDVDAVLPHVSRQVSAMIRLQLLTGMRPGEVVAMRGCDLDTSGKLWLYKPGSHKTQHHGHERVIYLGEQAKNIIRDFLKPNPQSHLFSPEDAEAERREKLHEKRLESGTPIHLGNKPGTNKKRGGRKLNAHYTVNAYAHAIVRGCERAFGMPEDLNEPRTKKEKEADTPEKKKVRQARRAQWRHEHTWHPHQLRHNAATRLRKDYGLEAAQVILGHKTLAVTELYAEKNVQAAQKIMAEVG